jgi:hypothetical protein
MHVFSFLSMQLAGYGRDELAAQMDCSGAAVKRKPWTIRRACFAEDFQ